MRRFTSPHPRTPQLLSSSSQTVANFKIILSPCQTLLNHIISTLEIMVKDYADHAAEEESADFLHVIYHTSSVINQIIQMPCRQGKPLNQFNVERMTFALQTFKDLIVKYNEEGQLYWCITNHRLRWRLDQAICALYEEFREFEFGIIAVGLCNLDPPRERIDGTGGLLPEIIPDMKGRSWWINNFGPELFFVRWLDFLCALRSYFGREVLRNDDKEQLRSILDCGKTGYVSIHKFAELLRGFGPFDKSIGNLLHYLKQPWFYGFLPSKEAKWLLEKHKPGTFLVRFGKSRLGTFAIAFVARNETIVHVLVVGEATTTTNCVKVQEGKEVSSQNSIIKRYPSLDSVIEAYKPTLVRPFVTRVPVKASWFVGDLNSEDAFECLQDCPQGTYLMRFSRKGPGYFAISYMSEKGIKHSLIEPVDGGPDGVKGYRFHGEAKVMPALQKLVSTRVHVLSKPYEIKSSPEADGIVSRLQTSLAEGDGKSVCEEAKILVESLLIEASECLPDTQFSWASAQSRTRINLIKDSRESLENHFLAWDNVLKWYVQVPQKPTPGGGGGGGGGSIAGSGDLQEAGVDKGGKFVPAKSSSRSQADWATQSGSPPSQSPPGPTTITQCQPNNHETSQPAAAAEDTNRRVFRIGGSRISGTSPRDRSQSLADNSAHGGAPQTPQPVSSSIDPQARVPKVKPKPKPTHKNPPVVPPRTVTYGTLKFDRPKPPSPKPRVIRGKPRAGPAKTTNARGGPRT